MPPAVDEIVRRCLAKDPDKRWQTAGDVLAELKRVSESRHAAAPTGREPCGKRLPRFSWLRSQDLPAWLLTGTFERRSTPPLAGEIRSIAVLPFEDLSGDPEQEYFADGMTEQLIAELAKISGLRTISRTSVMQA